MNQSRQQVRTCLQKICPETDFGQIDDNTELLRERVITSFQVIDLILHLEQQRGRPIERSELEPGCFRDIVTIAQTFLEVEDRI